MAPPARPLARLTRLAALVLWVAQLGLLWVSVADAQAEASAAPHVEPYGTRLHYAHAPDLCVACAAHALLGHSDVARPAVPVVASGGAASVAASEQRPKPIRRVVGAQPRAPPAWPSKSRE